MFDKIRKRLLIVFKVAYVDMPSDIYIVSIKSLEGR